MSETVTEQTLSAQESPLRKIFSSDFEFRIPTYQRPYRWEPEHAIQLLDDLEETLDRDSEEPYFLGSLVLVRSGGTKYDVIDGQQRLTTLTILFSVLRDLAEDDENRRTLAHMVMERGVPLDNIPSKPRLTVRANDAGFLREHVQETGGTTGLIGLSDPSAPEGPKRRARDNARALHARLSEWSDERRSALATLLRTRTFLVVVTTSDIDSAYRIFSVMNARGLDLAPTDIFKSMLLGELGDDTEYAQQWEEAERALGSDHFTALFREIRTIKTGERAKVELLKEFPQQVLNAYIESDNRGAFVTDLLLPYATAYEFTIKQQVDAGPEWGLVNASLRRLAMIDNKDWRPVAMWALVAMKDDPAGLGQVLAKLERLAAALLLQRAYTTPRIDRYLAVLAELKAGHGAQAPQFDLTDDEKAAAYAALDGQVYNMNTRRARFVLLRLDELLAADPGVTYSQSIVSIEHVLPQTPAADSQWVTSFSEEQRERLTHKLGNLLLLNRRKNSQARNYDFETKKEKYFGGTAGAAVFALTTQVLQHESWTPEVVEARQKELVKILATEWGLI